MTNNILASVSQTGNSISYTIWLAAIALVLVGALAGNIVILARLKNFFSQQRQRIFEGSEATFLLDSEAKKLIEDVRDQVSSHIEKLNDRADQAGVQIRCNQQVVTELVGNFKDKLNEIFSSLGSELTKVVDHSEKSQESSKKSLDILDNLLKTVDARDREIELLRDGFQKSLLAPLLAELMDIQDMLSKEKTDSTNEFVEEVHGEISKAFDRLGIQEIHVPNNPEDLPTHLWQASSAVQATERMEDNGMKARIVRTGFFIPPQTAQDLSKAIVLRKAIIERFCFDPTDVEPNQQ
jgi:Flp pilus assembly pilin Flp